MNDNPMQIQAAFTKHVVDQLVERLNDEGLYVVEAWVTDIATSVHDDPFAPNEAIYRALLGDPCEKNHKVT